MTTTKRRTTNDRADVPSDRLIEPTVAYNRSESRAVFGNSAPAAWWNDHVETWTIHRREIGRFRVELIAKTPRELDLSWLVTSAHRDGDRLRIVDSCRYTNADVQEYGADTVTRWINEDRRHMAEIVRSYLGMQETPRVFVASARVVLMNHDIELGQSSRLYGCIYDSWADFVGYEEGRTPWNGYAGDLVAEAMADARAELGALRRDLCTESTGRHE
jgi:hypothetical protein